MSSKGHSLVWLTEDTAKEVARDLTKGDANEKKVLEYEGLFNILSAKSSAKDTLIHNLERQIAILTIDKKIATVQYELQDDINDTLRKKLRKKRFQTILLAACIPAAAYLSLTLK